MEHAAGQAELLAGIRADLLAQIKWIDTTLVTVVLTMAGLVLAT